MPASERPLVAVLDIGKTNAKLVVADPATGAEVWSRTRPNTPLADAPYRAIDAAAIEAFFLGALAEAPMTREIGTLVPVAHGACAALCDDAGLVLPVVDYEGEELEAVAADYARERDAFADTGSPFLPVGLNIGRQLFYLERHVPDRFAAARHLMLWPQYWAWRLGGRRTSEATSLGCHSDLWRPLAARPSELAVRRGWARLMPPLVTAATVVGHPAPAVVARTGLDPAVRILAGIHDSNASFLRHRQARPAGAAFAVVSTGTWAIVLASGGGIRALREDRDCLVNVDAFGAPTPTARFMGGREFAAIAGEPPAAHGTAELRAVLEAGAAALPSFAAAGPFQNRPGEIIGGDRLDGGGRAALAALYAALMTDLCLDLLGARGDVVFEGPFAASPLIPAILAALRPEAPVYRSQDRAGTIGGACLLAHPETAPAPRLDRVAPPAEAALVARLIEHRRLWRLASEGVDADA